MRLVRANSLDLDLLQFDPDLTFAVFFLNADHTIYGRYGSRSSFTAAERDVSLKSLQLAMEAALTLHADYPNNSKMLAGKSGRTPLFATVDQSRWFQSSDQVATTRSCMHCHHIGNARHMDFVGQRKPLPDEELFAWPMPDAIGLHLDSRALATIESVHPDSPAQASGLRPGDRIVQMAGQPMISIADVQWVLHQSPNRALIGAVMERDGQRFTTELQLPAGWRRASDLAWRPTSTLLRDKVLGSLKLQDCSEEERRSLNIEPDRLALKVQYVVWESTPAGRAGIKRKDVIVSFAGVTDRMTESELLRRLLQHEIQGDSFEVIVRRAEQRMAFRLQLGDQ